MFSRTAKFKNYSLRNSPRIASEISRHIFAICLRFFFYQEFIRKSDNINGNSFLNFSRDILGMCTQMFSFISPDNAPFISSLQIRLPVIRSRNRPGIQF